MTFNPAQSQLNPPSRRKTPVVDGPIPFFGNQPGGQDFYQNISTPSSQQIQPIQSQGYTTSQAYYHQQQSGAGQYSNYSHTGYSNLQSNYSTSGSHQQAQQYYNNSQNLQSAAPNTSVNSQVLTASPLSPYINTPVNGEYSRDQTALQQQQHQTHIGQSYSQSQGAQYGYQPSHSNSTHIGAGLDQTQNVQGQHVDPNMYYQQPAEDAQPEPVFDPNVGQYYDPASGYYYDNDSGQWYLPQASYDPNPSATGADAYYQNPQGEHQQQQQQQKYVQEFQGGMQANVYDVSAQITNPQPSGNSQIGYDAGQQQQQSYNYPQQPASAGPQGTSHSSTATPLPYNSTEPATAPANVPAHSHGHLDTGSQSYDSMQMPNPASDASFFNQFDASSGPQPIQQHSQQPLSNTIADNTSSGPLSDGGNSTFIQQGANINSQSSQQPPQQSHTSTPSSSAGFFNQLGGGEPLQPQQQPVSSESDFFQQYADQSSFNEVFDSKPQATPLAAVPEAGRDFSDAGNSKAPGGSTMQNRESMVPGPIDAIKQEIVDKGFSEDSIRSPMLAVCPPKPDYGHPPYPPQPTTETSTAPDGAQSVSQPETQMSEITASSSVDASVPPLSDAIPQDVHEEEQSVSTGPPEVAVATQSQKAHGQAPPVHDTTFISEPVHNNAISPPSVSQTIASPSTGVPASEATSNAVESHQAAPKNVAGSLPPADMPLHQNMTVEKATTDTQDYKEHAPAELPVVEADNEDSVKETIYYDQASIGHNEEASGVNMFSFEEKGDDFYDQESIAAKDLPNVSTTGLSDSYSSGSVEASNAKSEPHTSSSRLHEEPLPTSQIPHPQMSTSVSHVSTSGEVFRTTSESQVAVIPQSQDKETFDISLDDVNDISQASSIQPEHHDAYKRQENVVETSSIQESQHYAAGAEPDYHNDKVTAQGVEQASDYNQQYYDNTYYEDSGNYSTDYQGYYQDPQTSTVGHNISEQGQQIMEGEYYYQQAEQHGQQHQHEDGQNGASYSQEGGHGQNANVQVSADTGYDGYYQNQNEEEASHYNTPNDTAGTQSESFESVANRVPTNEPKGQDGTAYWSESQTVSASDPHQATSENYQYEGEGEAYQGSDHYNYQDYNGYEYSQQYSKENPNYEQGDGQVYDEQQQQYYEQSGAFDQQYQHQDYYQQQEYQQADPSEQSTAIPQTTQDPMAGVHRGFPIMCFGFGGKIVTTFPYEVQRFNGTTVASEMKRMCGMVSISYLSDTSGSTTDSEAKKLFAAGPIFNGDQTKSLLEKKADLAAQEMDKLIAQIEQSGKYASRNPTDLTAGFNRNSIQELVVLCKFLKAWLQTHTVIKESDVATKDLVKILVDLSKDQGNDTTDLSRNAYSISPQQTNDLNNEYLSTLEQCLLSGQRQQAVEYCIQNSMWSHALIIASCVGKDTWQKVIDNFSTTLAGLSVDDGSQTSDLSAIALQYRLFSGMGKNSLSNNAESNDTNFSVHKWAKTLAMIMSNRTPGDKTTIMSIADRLRDSGHTVPAHICYLALDSSSIFFPRQGEEHRVSLLGSEWKDCSAMDLGSLAISGYVPTNEPRSTPYFRSFLSLRLTEMAELIHAMRIDSLDTKETTQGGTHGKQANPNNAAKPKVYCLPHLQAYKLSLAWWLIDCCELELASRYCDTIIRILEAVPKGVCLPFVGKSLVEQIYQLRERLDVCGVTSDPKHSGLQSSGPSAWLQKAIPKPSFSTLMSAFDSSIDKFITGESSATPSQNAQGVGQSADDGQGGKQGPKSKFELGPDKNNVVTPSSNFSPRSTPRPPTATGYTGATYTPPSRAQSVLNGYRDNKAYPNGNCTSSYQSEHYSAPQNPIFGFSEAPSRNSSEYNDYSDTYHNDQSNYQQSDARMTPQAIPVQQQNHQPLPPPPQQQQYQDQEQNVSQNHTPTPPMQKYIDSPFGQQPQQQHQDSGSESQAASDRDIGGLPEASGAQQDDGGFITPALAFGSGSNIPLVPTIPPVPSFSQSQSPSAGSHTQSRDKRRAGEEEDLGFGNVSLSKNKPKPAEDGDKPDANGTPRSSATPASSSATTSDPSRQTDRDGGDDNGNANSGMFGMLKSLWGRNKNQANLGDDTQLTYDPKTKRWIINGETPSAPTPPPPPPPSVQSRRSLESTPGREGENDSQNGLRSLSVPPPMGTSASGSGPHPRSTSTVSSGFGQRPVPPNSSNLPLRPPMSSGPRAANPRTKKSARAKYVDVFNS
ncbi:hypothetical protein H4219_000209 [Mycoemilia scoparia]|uniref:Protein transport protein sec16 n=1 Tax=Mycoemilia scoparia TaxID=417184 RepID=A0A9W8DX64_9FUNG|nr:hypothetical protein H4219_000209 [Mycoemilia scoparia]